MRLRDSQQTVRSVLSHIDLAEATNEAGNKLLVIITERNVDF